MVVYVNARKVAEVELDEGVEMPERFFECALAFIDRNVLGEPIVRMASGKIVEA